PVCCRRHYSAQLVVGTTTAAARTRRAHLVAAYEGLLLEEQRWVCPSSASLAMPAALLSGLSVVKIWNCLPLPITQHEAETHWPVLPASAMFESAISLINSSSMAIARSDILVLSNKVRRGIEMSKARLIRVITRVANKEWPPIWKKSSCALTRSTLRTSFQISARVSSMRVSGATKSGLSEDLPHSGAGRAGLLILPLGNRGIRSNIIIALGT